jgi:hypothetical protein
VDKKTTQIICTSYKNGKCHDYRLFKESGIKIQSKVKIAVDTRISRVTKNSFGDGFYLRKRARKILYQLKIRRTIQL